MGSKQKHLYPRKKGNTYIEKQQSRVVTLMETAMEEGSQRIVDLFECVLHDPDIMGKDTMGRERIEKIVKAVAERDRYYAPAFEDGVEADVKQEELDRELRAIHGPELAPFHERHPAIKVSGYQKAQKGWVKE